MLLSMISIIFDVFIIVFGVLVIVFGSVAVAVYLYCKFTHKAFKEVYPVALDKTLSVIYNAFKNDSAGLEMVLKMDKSWINPILNALCENGISCIENNAYTCSSVACYEFLLSNKEKELDINYFEKLIQAVFYNEVLPLYQIEPVQKEDIDVYIKKQEQILFIYVGHCQQAYEKINQYRQFEQKRNWETLNNANREMVE